MINNSLCLFYLSVRFAKTHFFHIAGREKSFQHECTLLLVLAILSQAGVTKLQLTCLKEKSHNKARINPLCAVLKINPLIYICIAALIIIALVRRVCRPELPVKVKLIRSVGLQHDNNQTSHSNCVDEKTQISSLSSVSFAARPKLFQPYTS